MTGRSLAETIARDVVACGLPGARPRHHGGTIDDATWLQVVLATQRERTAGLLDHAIGIGLLDVTEEQAAQAEAEAASAARAVLRREAVLLRVGDRLERAGIPFRVLKGPAIAHLDEDDPMLRLFADLDLLVPSAGLEAALAELAALGFRRDLPERRPGFDTRFAKEVPLRAEDGTEVDVHRLLTAGPLGFAVDADALWKETDTFAVGGHRLAALGVHGRFVHACLNAAARRRAPAMGGAP